MRKLVMLVLLTAVAVATQAASVAWKSGTFYAPDAEGGFSGTKLGKGVVTYALFTFDDAASYSAATAESVYAMDKSGALSTGSNTAIGNAISYTNTTKYEAKDSIYSALLMMYNDGANDWYMVAKSSNTVDDLGSAVSFQNLASAAGSWTKVGGGGDVPEPTSGLLLVLGGAMLALRRRRA